MAAAGAGAPTRQRKGPIVTQTPPTNPIQSSASSAVAPASAAPGAKAALWSLILGILGMFLCLPAALMAVILGIIAATKRGNPRKGMGIAGLILGGIGLLLGPFMLAMMVGILMPTLGRAREIAHMSMCGANMSGVGKAMQIHMAENDDGPPADLDVLLETGWIGPEHLVCPSAKGRSPQPHYFYFVQPDATPRGSTFVMCDLKSNHPRDGRQVLTYGASIQKFRTEAAFQTALARPENAAFAAALKKAEGP